MADACVPPTSATLSDSDAAAAIRRAESEGGMTVVVEEELPVGETEPVADGAVASPLHEGRDRESRGAGRHSAREVALQVLFALDLGKRDFESAAPADLGSEAGSDSESAAAPERRATEEVDAAGRRGDAFDRITDNFEVPPAAIEFARELVDAVITRSEQLDTLLGEHARNWRVARMAAVDRNVLRIAVFELSETDTPVAVVIDEAVDLARRFGSDTSPAFVNGVLDSVAREVRAA